MERAAVERAFGVCAHSGAAGYRNSSPSASTASSRILTSMIVKFSANSYDDVDTPFIEVATLTTTLSPQIWLQNQPYVGRKEEK
jgi:hypothetical protein